jgi:hypothetical protein
MFGFKGELELVEDFGDLLCPLPQALPDTNAQSLSPAMKPERPWQ